MAKSKKETQGAAGEPAEKKKWGFSRRHNVVLGILFFLFAIALLLSFISYFLHWEYDQSELNAFTDREQAVHNWLGKFGAYLADLFLYRGFGVASFILIRFFFLMGAYLVLDLPLKKLKKILFWDLYLVIVVSILFGFFNAYIPELGGVIGFEMNLFMQDYLGKAGTMLILVFALFIYLIFKVKISPDAIKAYFEKRQEEREKEAELRAQKAEEAAMMAATARAEATAMQVDMSKDEFTPDNNDDDDDDDDELNAIELKTVETPLSKFEIDREALKPTIEHASEINLSPNSKTEITPQSNEIIETSDESFVIEKFAEEDTVVENLAAKLVQDFGEFDPTLELSNYQLPPIDLLKDYSSGGITINQEELEENKNRIVETLRNYKIDIAQIKATVGPTVTLYEIVPEAGIRISKIKSLEDDIALSLSALGIRIIAPIPGKGTIGIEVPNKNPTTVSMKSVIGSQRFQTAEMELPIALGKTISNETFVVDLAKMPHLLMAGATGQGKSVGLNAVLTSLLYKKHPAEVKFVLVDP